MLKFNINNIHGCRTKILTHPNTSTQNLINIMIKPTLTNIIKSLITLNMILRFKDKFGKPLVIQIDHTNMELGVSTQMCMKMVQLNQNFKIQDSKEQILMINNLFLLMKTDLLPIHHITKNIIFNTLSNGNNKDIIDQLLNISIQKVINTMLN